MKYLARVLLGLMLVLAMVGASWATVVTLRIPVLSSTDDHEEEYDGDNNPNGIASPDLDLGQFRVGLRFLDIPLAEGTVITDAWVELRAESSSLTADVDLKIKGEDNDDPNTFSTGNNNIRNRWRNHETDAEVNWDITSDWSTNLLVNTPSITNIIQEILDRSDWDSGDDIVVMFSRRDESNHNRTVYSWDGGHNDNFVPVLVIVYDDGTSSEPTADCLPVDVRVSASSDDAEEYRDDGDDIVDTNNSTMRWGQRWLGLRFQSIAVPQGATITEAYIDIATGDDSAVSNDNEDGRGEVRVWGHDTDDAATFSSSNRIRNRSRTNANVTWSDSDHWHSYQEVKRSPDLTTIVQEIVSRSGWSSGNDMAIILEERKGRRPALSYDGNSALAPALHIAYSTTTCGGTDPGTDPGTTEVPIIQVSVASSPTSPTLGASTFEGSTASSDTLTIGNIGSADLDYTISGLPDWLTLTRTTSPNTVITSASDDSVTRNLAPDTSESFTVSYQSSGLAVGTHQATLLIADPDAQDPEVVVTVSITILALPESALTCSNIPLYVQNRVSPAVLINLDLSGSMDTKMSVVESIDLPTTPELKTIVQEVVNRTGWITGSDMVFIIKDASGNSGNRRAWSYDGNNPAAPLLTVTFTNGGIATTMTSRVSSNTDDAEQNGTSNYNESSNALDLGDRDVGLRFQSLAIPRDATIDSAFITFTPSDADSDTTNLVIRCEAIDDAARFQSNNDVSDRVLTTAGVNWSNIPAWAAPTQKSRLAIAQDVINEIVKNQSINWGFGTWEGNYSSTIDYTKIEVGCKVNTAEHMGFLQSAVTATVKGGRTPFVPSMNAAGKYFAGTKADLKYGENFTSLSCQDKFLIEITDGLGNIPESTSAADASTATTALAAAGISTVAVGFGIDDATMINAVAKTANNLGNVNETDVLYALHDTDPTSGDGIPFLAMNQQELLNSLLNISRKIENRFTGSAPAPTTSADDDELLVVLIAEFGSASWTGDLRARGYSLVNNGWSDDDLWVASEMIPETRSVWTVNEDDDEIYYEYSTQYTAKTLCKDIGDIINSAPIIIKWPNSYYALPGYSEFFNTYRDRNKVVYVGANDGQLHAFLVTNIKDSGGTITTPAGTELWSFIPKTLLPKLKLADTDVSYDMCDSDYCHKYYVDGSPQAADIYVSSSWYTILVSGLREGGEAYFALDITDGEPMSSGSGGAKYLWEFTDTELGQTWGDPRINRVLDASIGDGRIWGAFFGSGYAGAGPSSSAQTTKQAYLYGIDAFDKTPLWKTAADVWTNRVKLTSGTLNNDALSELLMVDKDKDTDFMEDFIFTGNLYGDLFRVINFGKGQTPVISTFYESNNSTTAAPIRARPSFKSGHNGEFWLYFGTGRYELTSDKTSSDQQYFFGLKEIPVEVDGNDVYNRAYVKPADLDTVTIPVDATTRLAANGTPDDLTIVALKATGYTASFTDSAGDPQTRLVKVVEGLNPLNEPWAIRLGTDTTYSERVVNQPLVVGDIVFFTSFVPDNDACGGSGKSYLYAVDFKTGKAPTSMVFDVNGDGLYDDADKINGEPVAAVGVGDGMATQPVIIGNKIFLNTTDPDEDTKVEKPNLPNPVTLKSWFDKSFE